MKMDKSLINSMQVISGGLIQKWDIVNDIQPLGLLRNRKLSLLVYLER